MRSDLPKFNPLERMRQVLDEVGKWPATPHEIRDARCSRRPDLARGLKPSVRAKEKAEGAARRHFRAQYDREQAAKPASSKFTSHAEALLRSLPLVVGMGESSAAVPQTRAQSLDVRPSMRLLAWCRSFFPGKSSSPTASRGDPGGLP